MAKAASQPNMMVYMVAVPYGSDGQQQPQQWMTDQSQYGNHFGGGQVLMAPMQPDSRGQTMPVAAMQPDQGGSPWTTGQWQQMPEQQQQWAGGWPDQSQGGQMPQQSQQPDQQPWTNPMAANAGVMQQGHQNLGMQGQQQHQQPQQFNMQQQQFQMQQQQAQQPFFVPQQFQQGNMQQQPQQTPQQPMQQHQTTQQPQFSPQQQSNQTDTQTVQGSSATSAAALSAKPKKRGLVNKPIAKDANPTVPAEVEPAPAPTPAPAPIPSAPAPTPASTAPAPQAPTEQRARKGLVNMRISKEAALGNTKEGEEQEQSKPKKGLSNKPISKETALGIEPKKEAIPEETPSSSTSTAPVSTAPAVQESAPTAVRASGALDMKTIAAWEPMKQNESDNKSMIKALGLEPVNPIGRPKPRPQVPEKPRSAEDTIQDLKKFSVNADAPQPKQKSAFRLKNATLTPGGGIKEIQKPEPEPKPEVPKVEETKASPSAPSQIPEPPKETKDNSTKSGSAVLLGREGFNRHTMLQFWKAVKDSPIQDLGYHTAARDEDACSPGEMWRNPRKNSLSAGKEQSWRRDNKGSSKSVKDGKDRMEDLTNRVANPYKKITPKTREEALSKEVLGLLNKICPENKDRIIKKLGEVQVDNSEELEIVIQIIFRKVTDDPHHCETYVDMVRNMSQIYSEKKFPMEEGQTLDFRRMLVNQCQNKFEDLLQDTDKILEKPPEMEQEEYDHMVRSQKGNALATMKFIGFLYLRKLVAAAVIRQVVKELLNGTQENPDAPPELQVEYAMELIQATGHEFDKSEKDKVQLGLFFGRLQDLKKFKRPDGKPCLSRRLQFSIQDLVDMRNSGWAKSKHKEVARTIAEVAEDAKREERENEAAANKASKAGGKGRGRHFPG
jgi:hypothetical protein